MSYPGQIMISLLTYYQQHASPSENMTRTELVAVAALDSEHSAKSLLEECSASTTPTVMEVPESEINHTALEVSNLIHGTAFSYGFPDARMTWKPKYDYSEQHGWTLSGI
jgi:hypothetical protein